MAHEISEKRFYAYDGQPAWHKIGQYIIQKGKLFSEALSDVLDGVRYSIEPMGTFDESAHWWQALEDQRCVIYRDRKKGIVRSFGQVGKDFQIVQPERLGELLDPVLEGYEVHTAGMLRDGKSIFLALKAGEREIVGEQYTDYLTFDLSFEPGRVMKVYATPVRTVCANTQELGIGQSTVAMDISHSGNADSAMQLATAFVRSFQERKEFFTFVMEQYTLHLLNDAEIAHVIESAFPFPSRPKILTQTVDRLTPEQIATFSQEGTIGQLLDGLSRTERQYVNSVARTEEERSIVRYAMDRFDRDFPHFKGTAYSLYNACTETSDWRTGSADVAQQIVSGGTRWREKIRAANALSSVVGVAL